MGAVAFGSLVGCSTLCSCAQPITVQIPKVWDSVRSQWKYRLYKGTSSTVAEQNCFDLPAGPHLCSVQGPAALAG